MADPLTETPPRPVLTRPGHTIRVALFQPTLAHYRVPVFRELASRPGIDLTVYYGDDPQVPNGMPDGFRAELAHMAYLWSGRHPLYWQQGTVAKVRRREVDVAIFSSIVHNAALVPGLLAARARNVATIVWGHGYSKSPSPWRDTVRRQIERLATVQLFYNRRVASDAVARGADPSRVFVALNSRDAAGSDEAIAYWRSRPAALEARRRELGIGPGPVLLFVSRLMPANRADRLITQVARLRDRYPTVQAVIVGSGPEEANLRAEASRAEVADRVLFFPARYEEREVAPFFLSADAFVYPKNAGLSILHAMAYSVPVLASDDVGGHNPEIEALRDGQSGIIYRMGDMDALEGALVRLFREPALRARLGAGGRRVVDEEFNITRMVDGMEAAIRAANASRGRPSSVVGSMLGALGLDPVIAALAELGSSPLLTAGAVLAG